VYGNDAYVMFKYNGQNNSELLISTQRVAQSSDVIQLDSE